MVGWFLIFGCLVSSKCRAADLKHRHKVGLPISEVVLLKAEILWEMLYHLKMRLVPCGHICQHSDFKEQEGVAHPHLHQHCSAGRLQTLANLYSQGVYSLAGTEGCLFVQGGLEEQGHWQVTAAPVLPQHRGYGSSRDRVLARPSILLAHRSIVLPLCINMGQAQTSIQKVKKSLFLNIATTFMDI